MGVSLYALCIMTLVGNAMVLHAIRTERRLQTVSNMFIMSLAIADLTVGLIVMPISSAYAITGTWRFGLFVCQFWLSADYTASTASILNLLILSLDRYWSIRSPLKYMRKRTKKRALCMIAVVWAVSAMWIVPIIGWHHWHSNGIRQQPNDVCETEFAANILFKLATSTANFYVPVLLMICLYVKIYYEIKKRSRFEIGQCNSGGGTVGSACGSSYDLCATNNNGSRRNGTPPKSVVVDAGEARHVVEVRRRRVIDDYEAEDEGLEDEDDDVRSTFSRQSAGSTGEVRYRHLALLTVKPTANHLRHHVHHHHSEKCLPQQYEGITVNVEYVSGDSGSGGSDKDVGRETARVFRIKTVIDDEGQEVVGDDSLDSYRSCGSTGSRGNAVKSAAKKKSKKKKKAAQTFEPSVNPETVELEIIQKDHHNKASVRSKRSCSQKSNLKSTNLQGDRGTGVPNLTTALRMRVTRKNFATNLRQQKKAARQLGVIMGAFVLCWLPYIITFIVTAYCGECISAKVHTVTMWLGYLNSTMNPFLYALCNANFKRAFKKMFCRSPGPSLYFPSSGGKTDHLFA
ncbi:histamine H1 receptor-like [Ornithodoros turicata]|uniref:histamine H1 receptor-like n=1 Tax=Ornithodoros turicata TaxID=34597 RepID=UPI0031395850